MGVMQVMRSLLMAQPHRESIVGTDGIATFDDDFKALMKVVIPFAPVQEGTGDPSPDNVRPISGWTGCKIGNRGKNYFDYSKWNTIAKINAAGNTTYKPIAVPVPNGTYTVHSKFFNDSNKHGFYANIGKSASEKGTPDVNASQWMKHDSSSAYRHNTVTVNVTGGYLYINMYKANANALTWLSGLQVEAGSSATDYEEYKAPQTIPITFPDPTTGNPMTVYGGTLTLNEDRSADLIISWRGVTLNGSENWTTQNPTSNYARKFIVSLPGLGVQQSSLTSKGKTNYVKTYRVSNEHRIGGVLCCLFGWGDANLYVMNATAYLEGVTDLASFKSYLSEHNLQAVYPRQTAVSYHFDDIEQLKSFIGQNNVWTDLNGNPTVGYWKHG